MKQRNHTFDFLCGLCILRMLILHAVTTCGFSHDHWMETLMAWTFYFMCFFFFKAGYFNKTVSGNSWAYCKDKFKRLMIPYFVWGAIGNIVYFGFSWLFPQEVKLIFNWKHLWQVSWFYGNPPCWFLLSFFVSYIAIHFINKVKHLQWIIVLFPFISYWLWTQNNPLWLSLDNVFMGMYCFFLGKQWHRLQLKSSKMTMFIISFSLLALFLFGNRHFHGDYLMSHNQWIQNPWGAGINVTMALCGISGLLMLLPQKRVPLINFIGEHSMVFFVVHYPIIFIYRNLHLISHKSFHNYADVIVLLLLILVFCAWIVPHFERVPLLSGRWGKKLNVERQEKKG